jgi:hypothetical protein
LSELLLLLSCREKGVTPSAAAVGKFFLGRPFFADLIGFLVTKMAALVPAITRYYPLEK